MRAVWRLGSALLAVLGLVSGCDDEEDDDGQGSGGTAGAETGGAAGGAADPTCDPSGEAACQNDTDCPFVLSGQLESAAYQCEDECFGDEAEDCDVACIQMELGATEACSTCYAELARCADEVCFAACSAEPDSPDCLDCLRQYGCASEIEVCGGVGFD